MNKHICSLCGAEAYYDGRCGDGPILLCGCNKIGSRTIKDRIGFYETNPTGARPIEVEKGSSASKKIIIIVQPDKDWGF